MQSNFQSATAFFTRLTILRGVIVGPDGYFLGSFCPVAKSLMFVPPMSITRTFGDCPVCFVFMAAPPMDHQMRCAVSFDAGRILEGSGNSAKEIRTRRCATEAEITEPAPRMPYRRRQDS